MADVATMRIIVDAAPALEGTRDAIIMLRTLTSIDRTWRTRVATKLFKFSRFIVRIACKFDGKSSEHEPIGIEL